MTRRVVVLGNAPIEGDVAALVDGADHVVRFNKARGFGGASGSRTDELWLINHGGQMAEWLAEGALTTLPAVAAARRVVLPVPMLAGHLSAARAEALVRERNEAVDPDRINHLDVAQRCLEGDGRVVERVSASEYRTAQRALAALSAAGGDHHPSTGFVAICRTLARARSGERVELLGFTFEGWCGHSWDAERRWVLDREREGRVTVHRAAAIASEKPTSGISAAGPGGSRRAAPRASGDASAAGRPRRRP